MSIILWVGYCAIRPGIGESAVSTDELLSKTLRTMEGTQIASMVVTVKLSNMLGTCKAFCMQWHVWV